MVHSDPRKNGWPWLLLAMAAGCQSDAEVGWTLGPLREVLPLQARIDGDRLRLRVVLVGWNGGALGPEDRVRTSAGTFRLRGMGPGEVVFSGRLDAPDGGSKTLEGSALELVYHAAPAPPRLVILLDNGTAAAAADPGLARLAGSQSVVEALACRDGCPLGPAEVGLLAMQGGTVVAVAGATRDAQLLGAALQSLAGTVGGEAPLWDGLLQAVGQAQAGGSTGAAVLCYSASGLGGPSRGNPAELLAALDGEPRVRLVAVQQLGQTAELVAAAARSDGLWLGVGRGGLEPTLRAAATGLRGSWELVWPVSVPVGGAERLLGTLDIGLGPDRRPTELELPLLR